MVIETCPISIHALLAESDYDPDSGGDPVSIISIHALLAESDRGEIPRDDAAAEFQSTLSLRRATLLRHRETDGLWISIHALLAESDRWVLRCLELRVISIHALLAESDLVQIQTQHFANISIHALLAESDRAGPPWSPPPRHFNPRSPCGERRFPVIGTDPSAIFQSTLSLRRATGRRN